MKRFKQFILLCGIVLTAAAFPVFAQENSRFKVNVKPLRDFAGEVSERVQSKELDLNENFLVEVSGELTKEGKFDLPKTRYIRSEGSEKMIAVAKSAIESLNDGGIFVYLSRLDAYKINLILEQNDSELSAAMKLETASVNRARSLASSFNALVSIGKSQAEDDDAKTILDGTHVSANDKSVTIKTAVEKSVGQEIIQRNLNKETKRQKTEAGR